jgi:hypothetical protein
LIHAEFFRIPNVVISTVSLVQVPVEVKQFLLGHVSRRALSERTNTSCVILLRVPSRIGLLGFLSDEAVVSLPSASEHTSSPPTPRSGGPTFFIIFAPSLRCEPDCVLFCRTRDLSVGFDLGFLPLLRAGPCERWALLRCFGRVLNERTILGYHQSSKLFKNDAFIELVHYLHYEFHDCIKFASNMRYLHIISALFWPC